MDLDIYKERAKEDYEDIFSKNEILTSRIDGKLSEARMKHSEATEAIDRSIASKRMQLLALEEEKAKQEINQALEGLERMEVKAPHDGIFVYKWEIQPGETVWPGQEIANLPLVDTMEAEVFVLEADAMGLKEGVPASLRIEAHHETVYEGSIKKIADLAKPRERKVPTQYFEVILKLEKTDLEKMKPGQRVMATLKLEGVEALVVPRQCIFDEDGSMVVYRQTGKAFESVPVTLGAGTPGRVSIEEGISAGDIIATENPFGKDEGKNNEGQPESEAKP
jgi:RND family efflux transporter MFP subunit